MINGFKEEYGIVPKNFFESLSSISGSQLKIIMYIAKHTIKNGKCIPVKLTIDEIQKGKYEKGKRIDSGTGLSTGIISKSLKNAIKDGFLVCFVDNEDKLRQKKYYTLRQNTSIEGITYKYDEYGRITEFDEWQKMTSTDFSGVENVDTDSYVNSIIENGNSNIKKDDESLNGETSPFSKSEDNMIISDMNDMIDINIKSKSINHINDMTYTKNENQPKYVDKDMLKQKYNLTDDEMKICMSRMKGKDIKYPAKFLEKVIQNYLKDKSLLKDAAVSYAAPRNYFNSYPQRKYDVDQLEKKLLEVSRRRTKPS
ncbi:hypothetical protein [Thermoanaerobacterium thermosaccharolyticum]|uniref:hypothetical protein n=1 Tax=Thermoanaerobacterium thermosaccharolyticum TaxID=1517 RepID=UPI00177D30A8|nr:hypothetical protein [Thermoanaerobacterium thermosaccharolyticum]MBE0069763.1 hypothetical protein [Thermoanaerobacterium thermosaccharolyticum]MBE0229490.1 hypothetical protein [Thermoanaerobacterium thermosaccharolyticum]